VNSTNRAILKPLSLASCHAYLSIFCLWAVGPSTAGSGRETVCQQPVASKTASVPDRLERAPRGKPVPDDWRRLERAAGALRPAMVRLAIRADNGNTHQFAWTGFVISKARRLVATAAHVADTVSSSKQGIAFVNGTEYAYAIGRAWYHPGLQRVLDDYLFVRSDDPRDGRVDTSSPDVAVLELERGGPELPAEFELGDKGDVARLESQSVGILGYRSDRASSSTAQSGSPPLAFTATVIGETTDVDIVGRHAAGPPPLRQYLWFHSDIREGGSGSPLFLSNGRAIGILTGTTVPESSDRQHPDVGFRIDCLRELLAHHKLDNRQQRERMSVEGWGPDV
jgi:hypothetical protein